MRVNNYIERMYAVHSPAPFLSVVINDCIAKGRDYYDGGPRYNTNYIQCCGIGTVTDSLSAIRTHVFEERSCALDRLLAALAANFAGEETAAAACCATARPSSATTTTAPTRSCAACTTRSSRPSTAAPTPRARPTT